MRRLTVAAAILVLGAATDLQAQASHTTFVPGLGATPDWWTRKGTISGLQARVAIPDPRNPLISTLSTVQTQANQVRSDMANAEGQHILIGHSMGGMVIRRAFFDDQSKVAGMLTVNTPHRGALVANNGQQLKNYVVSVIDAVRSPANELAGIGGSRPREFVNGALTNMSTMITQNMPVNAPASNDAKTTSDASLFNGAMQDNVPHGQVYSTIEKRRAWMRVANGALTGGNEWVSGASFVMDLSMGVLRLCQSTRRLIITYWSLARRCGRAYNALNTFDDGWHRYTANGQAFDGWIQNSSQPYPGTLLSSLENRQVSGVDHNHILAANAGLDAMAFQLINRLGLPTP